MVNIVREEELDEDEEADPNSVLLSYFQMGPFTFEKSAVLTIILQLLQEPLFDQLRNQEQLGYLVSCSLYSQ